MTTKTLPLVQKDFAWVNMTPKMMEKTAEEYVSHKKKVYAEIKKIPHDKRTFLNTLYALERCDDKFESFFSKVGVLSELSTRKEVRDASHKIVTDVSQKLIDVEYDRDLYMAVLKYYEGNFKKEKKLLRKEDVRLLTETLREYRRMGFDLPKKSQTHLKQLLKKLTKLSIAFRQNINDYQDYILCTKEELEGLSERFIATLPKGKDGKYMVTLQYPHIGPFMAEAHNREKRKELALKNLKKGGMKNLKIIDEIVKIRHDIATTLGYKHHADFKTENRMAKSAKTVELFQNSLIKTLLPLAKKDQAEMLSFGKTLGLTTLEHYDIPYVGNLLKKKLYDLDPETVRGYFTLENVLKEMFSLYEKLFSITIKKTSFVLWHKDVACYQVNDTKGGLIGYFAMDLFPRDGKFGHAACFDITLPHEHGYNSHEYIASLSTIVCNFPAPHTKTPSLLSLGEVETIFHEFGHCMHVTLSRARIESQSGFNVAWDFVETPSQIMENWVWDKDVMSKLSKHYVTGKKMPKDMIERIIKAKTFQNAYFYVRQLSMGKLDLDLHTGRVTNGRKAWIQMNKLYFNINLPEKETLFPAGFGHLVGYDAGYYSYLWALVYACDAFEEFKKKGNKNIMTNTAVGLKWRREVLEKGSSEDEMKLLSNFLGRKPSQKAFLKEVIGK